MLQHYGVPLETLIILLLLEKNSYYIIKLSVLCFFIVKFNFRLSGVDMCRFLLSDVAKIVLFPELICKFLSPSFL